MKSTRRMAAQCLAACVLVASAGCAPSRDKAPPAASTAPSAAAAAAPAGIDWRQPADEPGVAAAFAEARAQGKPVFLYWGAAWCPPCNQVKATLFNRREFIERSRAFVPVYIDGDRPGMQKVGARFKVRGYPTMVLFSPAGEELTRLPGEVEPQQYTRVLALGLQARRPAKDLLALARAGGQGLSANDWRLLAFYSWDTDEQGIASGEPLPTLLKRLAALCPAQAQDAATRLFLKAWAAADAKTTRPDAAARQRLMSVLGDAEQSRLHMDVLSYSATELARVMSAPATASRRHLLEVFDASLAGLANDVTLSQADRLAAMAGRVQLARLDTGQAGRPAPPSLLAEVREQVARADRETTDAYERQAVVTSAADLLAEAGLPQAAEALLKDNLARSHSPYYLMLGLAAHAKKRGDKAEALGWYEEAFRRSEGPATRLQWGASYVNALIELAPHDEQRIEHAIGLLFDEAASQPNVFYERSARSLQRVASKLATWRPGHEAVVQRLGLRLEALCAKLPPDDAHQRGVCRRLLDRPAAERGTAT